MVIKYELILCGKDWDSACQGTKCWEHLRTSEPKQLQLHGVTELDERERVVVYWTAVLSSETISSMADKKKMWPEFWWNDADSG
jgi:hypothetical protein